MMDNPFLRFLQQSDFDPQHPNPEAYPRWVEITDQDALIDVWQANHLGEEIERMTKEAQALQRRMNLAHHRREAAKIELFTKLVGLYPSVEDAKKFAGAKFVTVGDRSYYVSWDTPSAPEEEG